MSQHIKLVSVDGLPVGADAADLSPGEVVDRVQHAAAEYSVLDYFTSAEEFDDYLTEDKSATSKTYFKNIDSVSPFPATGVVVIAGRPGHGKSSLMRNIALRKALNGEKVVYLSYEFSQEKEVCNFITTLTGRALEREDMKSSGEYKTIKSLLRSNLLISHKVQSLEQIESVLSKEEFRGATIFIDYIQKVYSTTLKSESPGSESMIRVACNALNRLVLDNDQLIIMGSQLTQAVDKSPVFDVVKGGRSIEEVASMLLRIWRHNVSSSSALNDMVFAKGSYDFTMEVLKNRERPSGERLGLYVTGGIGLSDDKHQPKGEK